MHIARVTHLYQLARQLGRFLIQHVGHRTYLAVLIASLLVIPAPVLANMAMPPETNASLVGDPIGDLQSVDILHEELTIDLRTLADENGTRAATVTAVYHVRQNGKAQTLTLLFIAPGWAVKSDDVSLDGQPIPTEAADTPQLPTAWKAPPTTPGLEGTGPLTYRTEKPEAFQFTLTLPPGLHVIAVRYLAQPHVADSDLPVQPYQLAYVLAPARAWKSYGGLDVTVEVPAGWTAQSSLALRREGDVLRGHFSDVPADAIGLTVAYPVPLVQSLLKQGIEPLAVVLTLLAGVLGGRWVSVRRKSAWEGIPITLVSGVIWALDVWITDTHWDVGVPASQRPWSYTHNYDGLILMGFTPVFFGLAIAGTQAIIALFVWFSRLGAKS